MQRPGGFFSVPFGCEADVFRLRSQSLLPGTQRAPAGKISAAKSMICSSSPGFL